MGIVSLLDRENNIFRNKIIGTVTLNDILIAINNYYSIENYDPSVNSYWDMSEGNLEKVSFWEVKNFADTIKDFIREQKIKRKIAFYVKKPYHYGLVRMYITFMENEYVDAKIFRDEKSAIEWLKKQ